MQFQAPKTKAFAFSGSKRHSVLGASFLFLAALGFRPLTKALLRVVEQDSAPEGEAIVAAFGQPVH